MDTKLPQDVIEELERAIERAALGLQDRDEMVRAAERMDRLREQIRAEHGELNLAVQLIREARDG